MHRFGSSFLFVRTLWANSVLLALCLYCGAIPTLAASQRISADDVYSEATTAFQEGRLEEAEQMLRGTVSVQPDRPDLLGLLAIVLDAKKNYLEAEAFYARALHLAPHSAALWNNFGNHYLALGNATKAHSAFLRVLTIEPTHTNANLQLARSALSEKRANEALQYLRNLRRSDQSDVSIELLRARCLRLAGQPSAAMSIVNRLEKDSTGDERLAFSLGILLGEWEKYARAEDAFSRALEKDPANIDILHNLGLAALRAGHLERAQRVLEIAVQQSPDDVESLFNLGRVYVAKGDTDDALPVLARARRLAPSRDDILLYLAERYEDAGFFSGAADAYDEYLKLKPHNATARRERGFTYCRFGRTKDALPDLDGYVKRYPQDPVGLFELGVCEAIDDSHRGLQHLNEALRLKPDFTMARQVRGLVLTHDGRWNAALPDLKFVTEHEPENVIAWLQLGRSYLELGKESAALECLRRAQALAPEDRAVLTQLHRALHAAGQNAEASTVLAKLKTLGPEQRDSKASAKIFEYLSLDPAQQRERLKHNLTNAIATNPSDPNLRVQLGTLLLNDGEKEAALAAFREALALSPNTEILKQAAGVLLQHRQYALAQQFLVLMVNANPSVENRLDLALAAFHTAGPEASLVELDKIPVAQRNGDVYLLKAQLLDAMGRFEDAAETLNTGFKMEPKRADLYLGASLFLLKHNRDQQAVTLLEQATKIVPDDPDLLLTQAVLLEITRDTDRADALLQKIQLRWPEWGRSYLIRGIIQATHRRPKEALQSFRTAIALGEETASAYYYIADLTRTVTPKDREAIRQAISQALQLDANDALSHALAGRISLEDEDPATAVDELKEAIRLRPNLAEAHYSLMTAYKKLGRLEDSKIEEENFRRIREQNPDADNNSTAEIRQMLVGQEQH